MRDQHHGWCGEVEMAMTEFWQLGGADATERVRVAVTAGAGAVVFNVGVNLAQV